VQNNKFNCKLSGKLCKEKERCEGLLHNAFVVMHKSYADFLKASRLKFKFRVISEISITKAAQNIGRFMKNLQHI